MAEIEGIKESGINRPNIEGAGITMTRKELAQMIGEAMNVSLNRGDGFLTLVLEIIAEALEKGEKVKISGFGNFTVRSKKARKGRNPKTGEEIEIGARKVVAFRPNLHFRKALNKGSV